MLPWKPPVFPKPVEPEELFVAIENGLEPFREKLKLELGAAGLCDAKTLPLGQDVNIQLICSRY